MRHNHERGILIEPFRPEPLIYEGRTDNTSITSNKQIEELAIKRQV